jgi:hypothetical protein
MTKRSGQQHYQQLIHIVKQPCFRYLTLSSLGWMLFSQPALATNAPPPLPPLPGLEAPAAPQLESPTPPAAQDEAGLGLVDPTQLKAESNSENEAATEANEEDAGEQASDTVAAPTPQPPINPTVEVAPAQRVEAPLLDLPNGELKAPEAPAMPPIAMPDVPMPAAPTVAAPEPPVVEPGEEITAPATPQLPDMPDFTRMTEPGAEPVQPLEESEAPMTAPEAEVDADAEAEAQTEASGELKHLPRPHFPVLRLYRKKRKKLLRPNRQKALLTLKRSRKWKKTCPIGGRIKMLHLPRVTHCQNRLPQKELEKNWLSRTKNLSCQRQSLQGKRKEHLLVKWGYHRQKPLPSPAPIRRSNCLR